MFNRRKLKAEHAAHDQEVQGRANGVAAELRSQFESLKGTELEGFGEKITEAKQAVRSICTVHEHKWSFNDWRDMEDKVERAVRDRNRALSYGKEAHERVNVALAKSNLRFGEIIDTIQLLDDLSTRYTRYKEQAEINVVGLKRQLRADLKRRFAELWPHSLHDQAAFEELYPILPDGWEWRYKRYEGHAWRPSLVTIHARNQFKEAGISVDADLWNDSVVRYVRDPGLGDFIGIRPGSMSAVELDRRAAEALRDRSLKEAKIVLAYVRYANMGAKWSQQLLQLVVELEGGQLSSTDRKPFDISDLDGLGCRCDGTHCSH